MAEKQQRAMVRHIPTGRLVPIHPDFLKDPLWLSENNYLVVKPLAKFEQPAVSAVELPPAEITAELPSNELPELNPTGKSKKK